MTLNWETKNIKYFENNPNELWTRINVGLPGEQDDLNAETKALIFGSMAVGIGNLNYKTAPEFYARWKFFEKYDNLYLFSTYNDGDIKHKYLTPNIVIKHLGLITNVSKESEASWVSRIFKAYCSEKDRGYRSNTVSKEDIKEFLNNEKNEFENSFQLLHS